MCIFCQRDFEMIYEDDYVYAIHDSYPVNQGHCLIISKTHHNDIFTLNDQEWLSIKKALDYLKKNLDEHVHPDAYNIGVNNGVYAGQTIMHMHMHLIPRYKGDVKDPRGGVRRVIPNKQKY